MIDFGGARLARANGNAVVRVLFSVTLEGEARTYERGVNVSTRRVDDGKAALSPTMARAMVDGCADCGTRRSPQWRTDADVEGRLCNACGIRRRKRRGQ